jgi:G3E family GTPase
LSASNLLPVVIVAGLHTDQRRQAVRELLDGSPPTVVLHHDLSHAGHGRVTRWVWDNLGAWNEKRLPLINDCPCCALREDLLPELMRIAGEGRYQLAVVELWGGCDPQVMAETIALGEADGRAIGDACAITGMVTAVDLARLIPDLSRPDPLSEHGLHTCADDDRTVAESLACQIQYATVLAVSPERDPEEQPGRRPGEAMLRQLHPTARVIELGRGDLPGAARSGFDVRAAADRVSPDLALLPREHADSGVATLVWRRRRPLHPGRLHAALEFLVPAAQRSRGRFWLASRPGELLGWDAAGASLAVSDCGPWLASVPDEDWELHSPERRVAAAADWDPGCGDRMQLLTFTAEDLDADGITELLDSCLLTDEELAADDDASKALPDAFSEFLDPVPAPANL